MNSRRFKTIFMIAPFIIYAAFRAGIAVQVVPEMYTAGVSLFAIICLTVLMHRLRYVNYFPYAVTAAIAFFVVMYCFADNTIVRKAFQSSSIPAFLISRPDSVLYISLFVMAFFPPLTGLEPFTFYFAKDQVPEMFHGTRLFLAVNLVINYFWALLFMFCFFSQFISNSVLATTVPIVLQLGVGMPATRLLPSFLQKKLIFLERGRPAAYLQSARQALAGMPYVFNKKAAGDREMVIQFIITGSEELEGHLVIKGGTCSFYEGIHPSPSMTMKSPADVYLQIARKEINGTDAFFKKLIMIEGDVSLAMEMGRIFGTDQQKSVKRKIETGTVARTLKSKTDDIIIPRRYHSLEPGEVKNVLVIQSSPRRTGVSKTDMLAKAFVHGCERAGAKCETVYLHEKKINPCIGCYTCWTRTPGRCVFNDDAAAIMEKEKQADLVVYASPLYVFGITSSMKMYLDRVIPSLRPHLVESQDGLTSHPAREGWNSPKNVVIIGVCGFPEVTHFNAVSAYYHHYSSANGGRALRIVAEIYRPASEVLNNFFYADETKRVMDLASLAGEQVVSKGAVDRNVINGIADVRIDHALFREQANMTWDMCIEAGKTLPELQAELLDRKDQ